MKNHPVTKTEYFTKVKGIVDNIHTSGMLESGSGYCLSMSDIIHKLLHKEGIRSHIVECSLMVTINNPPGLFLMGYPGFHENNIDQEKRMQNHVVCITDTEIPILIDLSVSHIDKNIPFICAPVLKKEEHANISEFVFETSTWTYQQRIESELPKLHQRSIIDRIKLDNKVEGEIKFIRNFMFVLFTVSTLNFVRGCYDFYQTFIVTDNGWGPTKAVVHPVSPENKK